MKYTIFITVFLLTSCSLLYGNLGGKFNARPDEWNERLSPKAHELIEKSFQGIDMEKVVDLHAHVAGMGTDHSGLWLNPDMKKWWAHLGKYNRFNVYLSASGVENKNHADAEFVARLVDLQKNMPKKIKANILAFDYHYKKDGSIDYKHSEFYVPNSYVYDIALKHPGLFNAVVSIHPYKKNALIELEEYAKKGIRFVKWLPNAMGMDPSDKDIIPFYKMMMKYNMILLTHAGEEKAVEGESYQELANPLKLRLPLDLGVKVLVAHLASRGPCHDYDNNDVVVDCHDLFWRLFKDKKYEKNMFAEMSSLLIHARVGEPLYFLMEHPEFHHRIGYGSDYPLPAINWIYRTSQLLNMGLISSDEKKAYDEIYGVNPLLFHFVLNRNVRHPKTGKTLSAKAFESPFL